MVAGNERSVEMPHFGPRIETISNQSRVSPYPTGLGLRLKASPPVRHGTPLLHAESAGQSQIGRCLTLQRDAHRQQILAPESSGSGCPVEDIANRRSSTPPRHDLPSPPSRPTFATSRDRTQSGWDVLPGMMRCGVPCFMCGARCNRPIGKHYIRLCDDSPAHLCFSHDPETFFGTLHE